MRSVFLVAALLTSQGFAAAPARAIDCKNASSRIEKMICSDVNSLLKNPSHLKRSNDSII
jgi:uncharacterized protein